MLLLSSNDRRFGARSTEREFADLVEGDTTVAWWSRVETNQEVRISYSERSAPYYPDFLVRAVDGACWVVECKADRAVNDPDVVAKRAATERWVHHVNDSGEAPDLWRFLFADETAIRRAAGSWSALLDLGHVT